MGKQLALNGDFDKESHTVSIVYTSPAESELIRIFGKEAPAASSVIKRYYNRSE